MGLGGLYKARKFDVGERLLDLRTRSGLTQAELAEFIGASRRSVQGWEAGATYPQEENLQRLISVFLAKGALTPGEEYEEAFALWQQVSQDGGRRLARFDEKWFAALLADYRLGEKQGAALEPLNSPTRTNLSAPHSLTQEVPLAPFVDWGEAPDITVLFGRETELATLQQWVVEDHCRVIALLGLGGIGKTSLAINVASNVSAHFDAIFFRSLRNAPPLESILDNLIQFASVQHSISSESVADKITLLIQLFRERRYLVVLDNLETILQPGAYAGKYRTGYEEYGLLLQRLGEISHRSCLLLTSREKPAELGPMEGRTTPVRSLSLIGLANEACRGILEEKELFGTEAEVGALTNLYGGNPLALKLISEPIREVFASNLHLFLSTGDAFFNGVGKLLNQQFHRSAPTEQVLLYWLAIERDFVSLEALQANVAGGLLQRDLLIALESLRRRLLIERRTHPPAFTLQPVIMEYVTDRLVEQIRYEIVDGQPLLFSSHALVQATAKDYVRHTQERLIATPLLELLVTIRGGAATVEQLLLERLEQWRVMPSTEHGYGPGNVVNLLRLLRGDLRHLDLRHLAIRQAYIQGVEMQDTTLAGAMIHDTVFTESFSPILSLSICGSGAYWATSDMDSQIRVYEAGGRVIHRHWQMSQVSRIALAPDSRSLVGGSYDGEVHCWDVASAALKWSVERGMGPGLITQLAFCPDGRLLAIASDLGLWLCDAAQGTVLATPLQPQPVAGIAWGKDGTLLASGDAKGTVRFWAVHADGSAEVALSIQAHSGVVPAVAFSPAGDRLVSGSWDGTVKVWNVADGSLIETLARHQKWVRRVAWSADGRLIAYSVHDEASWLWDVEEHRHRAALRGHTGFPRGLLFTPDSREVVSASEDGSMRVWDAATGDCIRAIYGYSARVKDLSWSADGAYLAVSMTDPVITIHTLNDGMPTMTLHAHTVMPMVAWSPDGRFIAILGADDSIDLLDAKSGEAMESLSYPDDPDTHFIDLSWSPDGKCLATGTTKQSVQLFDITTRTVRPLEDGQTQIVQLGNSMRWSPNGVMLAIACEDETVGVWDVASGTPLLRVPGERWCPAWSGDSRQLAVVESRSDGCEVVLWNITSGERTSLALFSSRVDQLAWMKASNMLLTAGNDGCLRWWDVQSGACVRQVDQGNITLMRLSPDETLVATSGVDGRILICDANSGEVVKTLQRDRPYERLDITGLKGLTGAQRASLLTLGAIERSN